MLSSSSAIASFFFLLLRSRLSSLSSSSSPSLSLYVWLSGCCDRWWWVEWHFFIIWNDTQLRETTEIRERERMSDELSKREKGIICCLETLLPLWNSYFFHHQCRPDKTKCHITSIIVSSWMWWDSLRTLRLRCQHRSNDFRHSKRAHMCTDVHCACLSDVRCSCVRCS